MKRQQTAWDRSHHSIFENFALELEAFGGDGALPASGNQDVRYGLELQRKRLDGKGLKMQYTFIPRGHFAYECGGTRTWHDAHYSSVMETRTCRLLRTFYRGDRKVFSTKKNVIFYQIITNAKHQDKVGSDPYTCPNCGAVSSVASLQQGCPYCGTFFKMSDLFPKITNYYFIKDFGGNETEVKKSVLKTMIPVVILCIAAMTLGNVINRRETQSLALTLIGAVLGGAFLGVITGYFVWAVRMLGTLLIEVARSTPKALDFAGSRTQFEERMKRYSPEFSYEYFSDKVVSMLKMILFSEHPEDLPYYTGMPMGGLFSDIVEATYAGAVALKTFRVQNGFCYISVDVYMEDIYDRGGRLKRQNDKFHVCLCKNIEKPIDYYFSIKKIRCKNCSVSFDATKQRSCPACGTRYEVGDEDWIIEKIERR